MEEGANVNKLAKFKTSGEKSSKKFLGYVKKVNKFETKINQLFRCFASTKFFKFLSLSLYYFFNFLFQTQNQLYQPFFQIF